MNAPKHCCNIVTEWRIWTGMYSYESTECDDRTYPEQYYLWISLIFFSKLNHMIVRNLTDRYTIMLGFDENLDVFWTKIVLIVHWEIFKKCHIQFRCWFCTQKTTRNMNHVGSLMSCWYWCGLKFVLWCNLK